MRCRSVHCELHHYGVLIVVHDREDQTAPNDRKRASSTITFTSVVKQQVSSPTVNERPSTRQKKQRNRFERGWSEGGRQSVAAFGHRNIGTLLASSVKEVIQPQVPLRLPCYDFAPVTALAFGGLVCLHSSDTDFGHSQLPWRDGRCVQGPGTYSPRHR